VNPNKDRAMNRHLLDWTLRVVVIAAAAAGPRTCVAQGTLDDYTRADALREQARGKVFGGHIEPHFYAGGDRFWYRGDRAGSGHEFLVVDALAATRRPAFDHARLAAALTRATEKPHAAAHLPFERIEVGDDGTVRFETQGKSWRYDPTADSLGPGEPLAPLPKPARPGLGLGERWRSRSSRSTESPDGKYVAVRTDHNLHLRDKKTGESVALSTGGTEDDSYEARVYWSPDSTKLVALRTRKGDERKVYLIDSSPRDQVQPKLQSYEYLKPGDRLAIEKPHLFDVAAGKEIPVADDLFENPWSLGQFAWSADSSRFAFLYNQRGHQVLRLIVIDAATGTATPVIDERSDTFIDYSQKMYRHDVRETGEIIWASERDGWNHLYLYDGFTGAVKNPITRGEWVVRGVDRVDETTRQIWFRAGGIRPGQDPYHIHHARVNFDGTGLVVLTEGDGTHEVALSPDRRFLVDTYSRVDLPPVAELRRAEDGALVCALEQADVSALRESGWKPPERFVAQGRDGATDIYGVIYRPRNFDPGKKYPVIEQIYAGPQGAFVPKRFSPLHSGQVLAELGFIVVQIDGMGTNWRSKAFHNVCWKNLGDAGFPDRILWMKAAAAQDPSLDLTRVGVYGGSAGGQNALGAVLFHGDFYKAAVADCGCHDNRMDKIWWNEAWMGWPVGPEYAASSNVTNAHKLRGKLLLTVGELDRNVDPASTMQVVNALIKAGKDFEFVVFPGAGHGAGSSRYGERRRRDFFVRHLLGVEPPDRNAGDPS
jgi:dipeptidyl aminopeptidase/acylaminoacyl peptidase